MDVGQIETKSVDEAVGEETVQAGYIESQSFRCEDGECAQGRVTRQELTGVPRDVVGEEPVFRNVRDFVRSAAGRRETTARTLAEADALCRAAVSSEMFEVTITLPEQPFDFTRFRGLQRAPEMRRILLAERKRQLEGVQSDAERVVEALGGIITGRGMVVNVVDALLSPCELAELQSDSLIRGIEMVGHDAETGVDGRGRRAAMGIPEAGFTMLDGYHGTLRGSGTRVRYGVIENSSINYNHLSFQLSRLETMDTNPDAR